ncbi:hypothetical protein [Streptomyces sp. NBC_00989]|uniref:hypothetical protein n=1 Tax=Streptomyces sp. NBC_00989 TaxID=2903705 RepID=UPI0038654016
MTGTVGGHSATEAEILTRDDARVRATDVTEAPGCRRLDVGSAKEWAELAAEPGKSYGRAASWRRPLPESTAVKSATAPGCSNAETDRATPGSCTGRPSGSSPSKAPF